MESYDVLGSRIVSELLGDAAPAAKPGSFDPTFLINAASELAQGGANAYQSSQLRTRPRRRLQPRLNTRS